MQQPQHYKRVFFDRIFHRSYWTWRKHPTIIVPTMLASGLTAIEQAAITTPIILYLTFLVATNRLATVVNELKNGTPFSDQATTIGVILVLAPMTFAVLLIGILGGGFVLSA